MSRSRMDSRASIHKLGAPTIAAKKNSSPPETGRERLVKGSASVIQARPATTLRHTPPEEAHSASRLEPGEDKCRSQCKLRQLCGRVPSPPSTTSMLGLCAAASANARSIWSDPPHHVLQLVTPALLRMSSISASDWESQPPLDVLIMAPTFSADTSKPADFMSDVFKALLCRGAPSITRFPAQHNATGNYAWCVDAS